MSDKGIEDESTRQFISIHASQFKSNFTATQPSSVNLSSVTIRMFFNPIITHSVEHVFLDIENFRSYNIRNNEIQHSSSQLNQRSKLHTLIDWIYVMTVFTWKNTYSRGFNGTLFSVKQKSWIFIQMILVPVEKF